MGVVEESNNGFDSSIVKKGGEVDDGPLRSWVVDSNFFPSINHTWPHVTHHGFWFFGALFLFFS